MCGSNPLSWLILLLASQVAGLRQGASWEDVQWGLFMSKYIFPGADASTPLNWYIRQLELAGFEVIAMLIPLASDHSPYLL